MSLTIVNIADIHWGSINPKKLYSDLKNEFVAKISKLDVDMINILGDYFDHKIPLTEQSSILGIRFLNDLCRYTNKNEIELRLIKGTKTHDFNQLENLKHLERIFSNFRIINTVTEENFRGLRFLYVPEEYMNDQDEFYKEFKGKDYDCIYGHGTWDVFAFQNQIAESERPIKGSPVFLYNEWEKQVKYNIIFGHIHVHNNHKKLYYPGSFERWCYGEEKDKGFIIQEIDLDNKKSKVKFIKNSKATEYKTVNLDDLVTEGTDIQEAISEINNLKKDNSNFRIKVTKDISLDNLGILKETFSEDSSIKLQLKSAKEQIEEKIDKDYDFLGNDVSENIQAYIKEKFGKELTLEEIDTISKEKLEDD